MSAGCTLTLRGSQPTCKGAIHPPPPCHCTLIPLNPLQASKACATWDTHTCAHIVHAHTRKCPRSTFHTLPFFFSAAATPTSGHRFSARSFQQPVFSLSAAFLKDWQGLPPDRAIMPQQIYGVDPALHFSQIPPSTKLAPLSETKFYIWVWIQQRAAISTCKYSNTGRCTHRHRRNNCSIHNRCQHHKETETQRPIYRVRRCTKLLNLAYNCMNLAKCLQTDTHWLTNTRIDRQETGVGADTTSVSVSSQTHLLLFFLTLSTHNSHQCVSLLVYLFMWSGLTGKSHKRLKNSGVHYRLQP